MSAKKMNEPDHIEPESYIRTGVDYAEKSGDYNAKAVVKFNKDGTAEVLSIETWREP